MSNFQLDNSTRTYYLRYNEDLERISGTKLPKEQKHVPSSKTPNIDPNKLLIDTNTATIILSGIGIALLIFLIRRFHLIELLREKWRVPHAAQKWNEEVLDTNIYDHDFESEIQAAQETTSHSELVKLHYLRALRLLCDNEVLEWQKAKTPTAYLHDLQAKNAPHTTPMTRLTHAYLYVFFGHYLATEEVVEQCRENEQAIADMTHTRKTKGGGL